jgi:hypothetical protein
MLPLSIHYASASGSVTFFEFGSLVSHDRLVEKLQALVELHQTLPAAILQTDVMKDEKSSLGAFLAFVS